MINPSVQVCKMLALLLQTTTHLAPAEVGTDVHNGEAVSHQESLEFQSIIYYFGYFDGNILGFADLWLFDFSQFIITQYDDSYCWL